MNFKRHFIALGVAFAALLAYGLLLGSRELQLGNFALYGALHALAVVVALERDPGLPRCALFVVLTACADGALLYLGLFAAASLAHLLAVGSLYVALGLCALFGAIAYGLLLRGLLFPALRPRRIVQIASACVVVCVLVEAAAQLRAPGQLVWIAGAWWLAFSSGLWVMQRRFHALGPQPEA